MGMGKTIEMISLIMKDREIPKPNVVVDIPDVSDASKEKCIGMYHTAKNNHTFILSTNLLIY